MMSKFDELYESLSDRIKAQQAANDIAQEVLMAWDNAPALREHIQRRKLASLLTTGGNDGQLWNLNKIIERIAKLTGETVEKIEKDLIKEFKNTPNDEALNESHSGKELRAMVKKAYEKNKKKIHKAIKKNIESSEWKWRWSNSDSFEVILDMIWSDLGLPFNMSKATPEQEDIADDLDKAEKMLTDFLLDIVDPSLANYSSTKESLEESYSGGWLEVYADNKTEVKKAFKALDPSIAKRVKSWTFNPKTQSLEIMFARPLKSSVSADELLSIIGDNLDIDYHKDFDAVYEENKNESLNEGKQLKSVDLGVRKIKVGETLKVFPKDKHDTVVNYENAFKHHLLKQGVEVKVIEIETTDMPWDSVEITFESTKSNKWYRAEGRTKQELSDYFGL
jgi:hypothetical protein